MKSNKSFKKYHSKDWLYNQYHILKKSMPKIAKEQKINYKTLHYWMEKRKISRRSISKAMYFKTKKNVNLSKKSLDFINGNLLGDGCLSSSSKYSAKLGFLNSITKNNCIYISSKSVLLFLDYIGKCPVKCYEYKWNINNDK